MLAPISRRRDTVRIAPMDKEARITISRWMLREMGMRDDALRIGVQRKDDMLALTKGGSYSIDHSYSHNRVRIYIPKGVLIPGCSFACVGVEVSNGVAYIRIPRDKLCPNEE
jgi:hypothetical protein